MLRSHKRTSAMKRSGYCLLLLSLLFCLCGGEFCGAGWMPGVQNRCIKIVSTSLTWDAAMGTCKDLGGTLATLDSPSRNAFVIGNLALITDKLKHLCWWIGGRKLDGKFQWLDEHAFAFEIIYSFWRKGQPDNVLDKEDRLQICKWSNDGTTDVETYGWNDHTSTQKAPFICEKKADVRDVFG